MRLKLIAIIAIITGCIASVPIVAYSQTLESSNYKIEESFIGPSGDIESSSSNYSSIGSLGDIGVGESNPGSGGNFKTIDGYTTTDDPSLTFAVDTSNISFGSLSLSSTSTSTATFSAYNYTSFGYVIQIVGPPPSSGGGHTLDAMASTSSPSIGTEQFGINLAANTSPISFGAVPTQVPSASFSYGTAATGYNTANQYRYVNGETIAHATKSSGRTDYTISYITNISTSTPGGSYTGAQELVCVGTY